MGWRIFICFDVGTNPPKGSTLFCKCCKVPPSCLATYDAKIYYVLGKNSMTRACVHFGTHDHPVKVGAYRDDIARGESLVEEHVHRTPFASKSAIVLDATKEMVGDMLVAAEGAESKTLELDDLLPLFDRCKELTSPNIRNRVTGFKYF